MRRRRRGPRRGAEENLIVSFSYLSLFSLHIFSSSLLDIELSGGGSLELGGEARLRNQREEGRGNAECAPRGRSRSGLALVEVRAGGRGRGRAKARRHMLAKVFRSLGTGQIRRGYNRAYRGDEEADGDGLLCACHDAGWGAN